MIFILTGEVHSGKSTALKAWLINRNKVGGFLSPDIENKRFIQSIKDDYIIPFQVDASFEGEKLEIGPYIFDQNAFNQATDWTMNQMNDDEIDWIIIDELGKLELKEKGFYRLAKSILKNQNSKHIIFVIRDFLVDDLVQLLSLKDAKIIKVNDLKEI